MSKYIQKLTEVDAMQFDGKNATEIAKWSEGAAFSSPVLEPSPDNPTGHYLQVRLFNKEAVTAIVGDYVVRGKVGNFFPMKKKQFEVCYEPLTSTSKAMTIGAFEELLEKREVGLIHPAAKPDVDFMLGTPTERDKLNFCDHLPEIVPIDMWALCDAGDELPNPEDIVPGHLYRYRSQAVSGLPHQSKKLIKVTLLVTNTEFEEVEK